MFARFSLRACARKCPDGETAAARPKAKANLYIVSEQCDRTACAACCTVQKTITLVQHHHSGRGVAACRCTERIALGRDLAAPHSFSSTSLFDYPEVTRVWSPRAGLTLTRTRAC
eukprot:4450107-Prymnesium_polylepis.4